MLIKFNVENYRSIKEPATLSMLANNYIKTNTKNTFSTERYSLLKSVAIYGANASGKSNIIKALDYARDFIINSIKESKAKEPTKTEPFLLSTESEKEPSSFEFVLLIKNEKYRYGFSLTNEKIIDEWLFRATKEAEELLFERHLQEINLGSGFKEGEKFKTNVRENALFLSLIANLNGDISLNLIEWFSNNLNIFMNHDIPDLYTTHFFKEKDFKSKFMKIFKQLDLFIEEIQLETPDIKKYPDFIQKDIMEKSKLGKKISLPPEVKTIHRKYNAKDKFDSMVEFDLVENESKGTKRLFSILGPILYVLEKGEIIAIDELEVKLHPLIVKFLIKLFNSKRHNKNNAQLIFTTHDVNILDNSLIRKDQIWFTQKNKYGATSLYSLNEYKGVRNCDASFKKGYLSGQYGAIPLLNDLDFFEEDCQEDSE